MGVSETNGAQPYLTPQIKNHPKVVLVARGGIEPRPRMPNSSFNRWPLFLQP